MDFGADFGISGVDIRERLSAPVYPGGFSDPRECGPPGMGEICCGPPGMLGIPGVNPREEDTLIPNKDYFGVEFGDQLSSVLSRVVEFMTVWKIDLCIVYCI